MNFLKENNGKWSIKRVSSFILLLVAIVFAALTLKDHAEYYVTFFGSAGMLGLGLTVVNNIFKTPGNPPDEDEENPPG